MFSKKKSYSLGNSSLEKTLNARYHNAGFREKCSASTETILQQVEPVIFRPFLGSFYALLHAMFNQSVSVILKKLPYINPCQLSLIRHTGIFIAILPIAVYHSSDILGDSKHRFLLIMRAFFAATGFYLQFMAYSYLPLAEASIIMSTLPLVTAVMARIVLRESYGLIQKICLIMTVFGVLLALKIPELLFNRNGFSFNFTYAAGLMAAVGNVLFLSLSCIYIRKLKEIHFSIMMLYLGVIGMIENLVINGIFISFAPAFCGWDQILCILLAVFCFISNCLLTCALQVVPAGLIAVQKSSFDILTIIVFQIIFFDLYPDSYVIYGACLVLLSLSMVGVRNWILMKSETSKIRKYFSWIKK